MATVVADSSNNWGLNNTGLAEGDFQRLAAERGLLSVGGAMDNFNPATYMAANPDLGAAGIDTPEEARRHYMMYGSQENRPGTPGNVMLSGNTAGTGLIGMDTSNLSTDLMTNNGASNVVGATSNSGSSSGQDAQGGGNASGNGTQESNSNTSGNQGGGSSQNSSGTSGTQTVAPVDYDRIGGLFNTANTGINTANQTLGTINTNVGNIGTDVGNIKTNLGTVGTNVNDIKTNVGTIGTDLGNFRTAYNTGLGELKGLFSGVNTDLGKLGTDLSKYSQTTGQDIENLSKDTLSGFAQATENREDIQNRNLREFQRNRSIAAATQNMLGNQGGNVSTQQPITTSGGPQATLADTSQAAQAINTGANSVRIPQGIINNYSVDPRDQVTPVQMASGGVVGNIPSNNLDKSMNSGMTMDNTQPGIMSGAMPQPKPQDPLMGLRRLMNRGKKKVA